MRPSMGVVNGNLHHILCVLMWSHPIYRPTVRSAARSSSIVTYGRRVTAQATGRVRTRILDAMSKDSEARAGDRVRSVSRVGVAGLRRMLLLTERGTSL